MIKKYGNLIFETYMQAKVLTSEQDVNFIVKFSGYHGVMLNTPMQLINNCGKIPIFNQLTTSNWDHI